jgi:hypothetical protein
MRPQVYEGNLYGEGPRRREEGAQPEGVSFYLYKATYSIFTLQTLQLKNID